MLEKFDLEKQVSGELIYDYKAFDEIKNRFPTAVYEDASDEIHQDRISVSIPGVPYKEFFTHAISARYHETSFTFQLLLLNGRHKEFNDLCLQCVNNQKQKCI